MADDIVPLYLKRLSATFTIKAMDEDGAIEGYASVFDVVDTDGDVIRRGAFSESIQQRTGIPLPMLWQHDAGEPIGVWTDMREDERGLYVRGRLLVQEVAKAKEARALAKAGALGGMSIGFMITEGAPLENARRGLEITKADLWETSLVTFPANPEARFSVVKGQVPSKKEIEAFLARDAGMSRAQAKAFISKGYAGLVNATREAGDDEQEIIQALEGVLKSIKGVS